MKWKIRKNELIEEYKLNHTKNKYGPSSGFKQQSLDVKVYTQSGAIRKQKGHNRQYENERSKIHYS